MSTNNENKQNNIKKNFIQIITLGIFILIIVVADIFLIADHGKTFSAKENRMLTQGPELTWAGITSGKFMTEAEDFVSDQFFLRDGWISYKLTTDKTIGKREVNGVYLGSNNYLIEKAKAPDTKNFERNLEAIKGFCGRHSQNITMAVVPNVVSVCSNLLPAGAPVNDQQAYLNDIESALGGNLTFVNVTEALKEHNKEYIYYKSDHHWTSLGAKYAFENIAPYMGITDYAKDYTVYCVTDSFSGTLSSASGADYVKDEIEIYVPSDDGFKYVVEYVGENYKSATIYNSDALDTNSKYDVFFGGNHPLIKINTTAKNEDSLLVIKDSYANAFLQFLLPYYSNIYIVDPRYYSDDIERLISDGNITDILFLYNLNTYVEDNSIAGVLETL